jgi:hypothetical protein
MPQVKVSRKFIAAVKLSSTPAYRIAQLVGLNPATLSKIMCGIIEVKPNDPRVISVSRVIGLPVEQCFEEERNLAESRWTN